jgi:glycosyltransferase involved in cell wall biosynthesis
VRVSKYLLTILHNINDQHIVLHQHDYISTGLAANILKLNHSKYIWTNHSSQFLNNFKKPINKLITRILYQRTDGIIAPSPELFEMSGKLWPNKERIYIPNGVNLGVFRPVSINEQRTLREELRLPKDRIIVFCPRRWEPKNGVIYLIKALHTLKTRSANCLQHALFVFAGNNGVHMSYEAEILRLIEEYDLHQPVRLLGEVPYNYIDSYMKASDVVIVPSLMEAVSLAILEAMACGKIVIATNVGGIPEVVKDAQTGFLVQPGNVEELAGKIDEVCNLVAGGELKDMASRARALVETGYSWEKVAEKTVGFYRQILGT